MRWLLLLLLGSVVMVGCGYSPPGHGPGFGPGVQTVYVQTFKNRTAEPFLDTLVTNRVIERFRRDRRILLVNDAASADVTVSGQVTSYSSRSIVYDQSDNILTYRSQLAIASVMTRNRDGMVLWKGAVAWDDESDSADNKTVQEDSESSAIGRICTRVADQLYYRMQDNF